MSEIKYVVNGQYVDPNGKELGEAPSKTERAKKPAKPDAEPDTDAKPAPKGK